MNWAGDRPSWKCQGRAHRPVLGVWVRFPTFPQSPTGGRNLFSSTGEKPESGSFSPAGACRAHRQRKQRRGDIRPLLEGKKTIWAGRAREPDPTASLASDKGNLAESKVSVDKRVSSKGYKPDQRPFSIRGWRPPAVQGSRKSERKRHGFFTRRAIFYSDHAAASCEIEIEGKQEHEHLGGIWFCGAGHGAGTPVQLACMAQILRRQAGT